MKKFLIQSILLLAVIVVALYFFSPAKPNSRVSLPFAPAQNVYKSIKINDKIIKIEIVDTQEKRNKGLSERDSIASDEGMLFIYPNLAKHPFWMKGMKFPIDFIWIRDDKVVDIIKNASPPQSGTKDEDLPRYLSITEVNKVLEINAGAVERLGINIGDIITISDIPK